MFFDNIALHVPRILLPRPGIDLEKWAVIACDQFTSQPAYWQEVARIVDGAPSTLNLIFPEAYLEANDRQDRINTIHQSMDECLRQGLLVEHSPGFVLVDRTTAHVASRKGLVVALDLKHYDYQSGASTLIRATEGTVEKRLPPRMQIRRTAPLEIPHIMVLIDDPDHSVIEPLFDQTLDLLYDTNLMLDGGRVRGWHVHSPNHLNTVATALSKLSEPSRTRLHYGDKSGNPMLYAMGDGNHSFASSAEIWREITESAPDKVGIANHPARHALVELVNLHDPGLQFQAIHRVVFGVQLETLIQEMKLFFRYRSSEIEVLDIPDHQTWNQVRTQLHNNSAHHIPYVAEQRHGIVTIHNPDHTMAVGSLQAFLQLFSDEHDEVSVDYIHGEETVEELGSQANNVGFFTRPLDKHSLFRTVIQDGVLPRKAFSLGEAVEKRYYLECRRL